MVKIEMDNIMSDDTVDHEARRMALAAQHHAERALDGIVVGQRSLDTALRDSKLFETEVRTSLNNMAERHTSSHDKLLKVIHESNEKLHQRINQIMFMALIGVVGMIVSTVWTKVVM